MTNNRHPKCPRCKTNHAVVCVDQFPPVWECFNCNNVFTEDTIDAEKAKPEEKA